MRRRAGLPLLAALAPSIAAATPGPDSTAVLFNADLEGSRTLAARYADARAIPANQRCGLPLPPGPDLPLADFEASLLGPLRDCLDAGAARSRIEAVVLVRGVPMRVRVPTPEGEVRVSLAAALGLWDSTRLADGAPVLGAPPGRQVPCGEATCLGAAWRNPYSGGAFAPGWHLDSLGVRWAPVLVTALFGRSDEDAGRLLDSALAGDAAGGVPGELLLMDGADPARGALDREYEAVLQGLLDRGFLAARRSPFDADLTGHTLAAFVTGTDHLGLTIEGNLWSPGALVDNLTSFGAVAENFAPEGESQVSVARFVAMGVAGVHGTTDEPLNNCFPTRSFLLDAVDGATLAEAFHSNLPFAYWQNLVLGDPMAAPYAVRPTVALDLPAELPGPTLVRPAAVDPAGRGAPELAVYVDGAPVTLTPGGELCALPADEDHAWLAVARALNDGSPGALWRPKGWWSGTLRARAGAPELCAAIPPDAGVPPPDAALPADAMAISPDAMAVPADAMAVPADAMAVSPDAMTISPDALAVPGDALAASPDAMAVPADALVGAAPVNASRTGGGCTVGVARAAWPSCSAAALLLFALCGVALRTLSAARACRPRPTWPGRSSSPRSGQPMRPACRADRRSGRSG